MSTPEEAYSGKKPDLSHLRIFGANVYMHVTKDARKKLEPTTKVGIFVQYTNTPHNYRVYFPDSSNDVPKDTFLVVGCYLQRKTSNLVVVSGQA